MPAIPEVSVHDLQRMREEGNPHFLLDVRRPEEHEFANIEGTIIPLDELGARLDELEPHRGERVIVYCRSGARSANAVQFLRSMGYDAHNLAGGILAWSREIDPEVPTY